MNSIDLRAAAGDRALALDGQRGSCERVHRLALRALTWADENANLYGDGFYRYQTRSGDGKKNQGWKDSEDAIVYEDRTQGTRKFCGLCRNPRNDLLVSEFFLSYSSSCDIWNQGQRVSPLKRSRQGGKWLKTRLSRMAEELPFSWLSGAFLPELHNGKAKSLTEIS